MEIVEEMLTTFCDWWFGDKQKEENEGRREKQVKEIRQGQELQKDVCTLHHPLKSPTEYPGILPSLPCVFLISIQNGTMGLGSISFGSNTFSPQPQ